MAKKTYWTKCGIEFPKSTNADVTGYELKLLPSATDPLKVKDDIEHVECRTCPYVVDVTEGWGENKKHIRFECRAGSKKPNNKTEWTGSLDDKNTLNINSLDHQLMEQIRQYCKDQPDISASYNADHMADCRRTLSISCSANKKGMAAKRELIEKFFSEKKSDPIDQINKMWKDFMKCGACDHAIDYGESVEYRKCELKKRRVSINQVACNNFESAEQEVEEVKEDCTTCMFVKDSDKSGKVKCSEHPKDGDFKPTGDCPQYTPGGESSIYIDDPNWDDKWSGDSNEMECPNCNQDRCPFNDSNCNCLFGEEDPQSEGFNRDVLDAVEGLGCKSEKVLKQYEAISNPDTTDYTIDAQEDDLTDKQPEKKKPRIGTESGCNEMREDCPCFCSHNDGCSVLLVRDSALKSVIKNIYSKYDIDCGVYKKTVERVNGTSEIDTQVPEIANDLAEIDTKSVETVTFDYSTVDDETADFLRDKAFRITAISGKAKTLIGKELKEAQDVLSKRGYGCFEQWYTLGGFTKTHVYRLISRYEFVCSNLEQANELEQLPDSLIYEISKPSAPKELQEQVLSGDITTHKQYKEKEAEWKDRFEESRKQQETLRIEKQQAITKAFDAERKADRLEGELEELKDQIDELKDQADQDPKLISTLQNRIRELETELKDKPIEAAAVQVVEKIPERAAHEIIHRLYGTLMAAKIINDQDIQIVHEHANFEMKEAIIEFFENLRDMIPGYLDILKDNVPIGKCEDCQYCEWDGLKEEDELKGLILCKFPIASRPQLWPNAKACDNWMERQV